MRRVNLAGIALLHEFESFVGHAYPDPYSPLGKALRKAGLWKRYLATPMELPADLIGLSGAPWTIGWGFTHGVRANDRMTRAEADHRLGYELQTYTDIVLQACTVEPNDNELAAMVCLAWNIGVGWNPARPKPKGAKDGFRQSTVLRAHNRGDSAAASRAFRLWNKANGEVSAGLERRRAAESALYLRPAPAVAVVPTNDEPREIPLEAPEDAPMPQSVDAESTFSQSPISRAAIGGGAATTLALVDQVAGTAASTKYSLSLLGDWLIPILLVLLLCALGYIAYTRIKQRKEGWA